MANEPDNPVLKILRKMQTDLSALKNDVSVMKEDIAGIKSIQDDHTVKLVFIADETSLLRTATLGLIREVGVTKDNQRNHRSRIDDLEHRVERLEGAH